MPRNRHTVATTRWIVTGVALFVGTFVLSFGIGNGQRVIMVVGGATMLLGATARYATLLRRNPRRWVTGTGRVVEVSDPPAGTRFGRCSLQLTIDAPGMPAETVLVRHPRVPVALWPSPGHDLPIQVAADDVGNVRVLWKSYLPVEDSGTDQDDLADDGVLPGQDGVGQEDLAGPGDLPGQDVLPSPAEEPHDSGDGIDFDLDGPPTSGTAAPAVTSAQGRRVPRPRPSPRPSPQPRPDRGPTGRPSPRPRQPAAVGVGTGSATPAGDPDGELFTAYPSAHPGPAGAIHGVGVTVLVTDLGRSAAFYRDQLGFYEMDGGEGNLVLASGETRLVLRQVPDIGTVDRRLVHLNLEVTDIDAVYADLRASGIRFTYPPRAVNRSARLELWAAAFRDPDGHGIALTQWRPR